MGAVATAWLGFIAVLVRRPGPRGSVGLGVRALRGFAPRDFLPKNLQSMSDRLVVVVVAALSVVECRLVQQICFDLDRGDRVIDFGRLVRKQVAAGFPLRRRECLEPDIPPVAVLQCEFGRPVYNPARAVRKPSGAQEAPTEPSTSGG